MAVRTSYSLWTATADSPASLLVHICKSLRTKESLSIWLNFSSSGISDKSLTICPFQLGTSKWVAISLSFCNHSKKSQWDISEVLPWGVKTELKPKKWHGVYKFQHWMEVLILTTYLKILYLLEQELLFTQMSPLTIIKHQKRFNHSISVQNSQNWEDTPIFCTRKCKILSQCLFFEVWMQDLYTKALVGMAQKNTSQDCKLPSQRNSMLQTQTLYQGFVLRSFLRLFQSMPLSWKNPTG